MAAASDQQQLPVWTLAKHHPGWPVDRVLSDGHPLEADIFIRSRRAFVSHRNDDHAGHGQCRSEDLTNKQVEGDLAMSLAPVRLRPDE